MRVWLPIVGICCAWLVAAAPTNALLKPHPSIYRMANSAAWVVEGTLRDGGVVEITREHFAAPGVVSAKTASVPSLPAMPLVSSALVGPATKIHADTVLLFLEPGSTPGADLEPLRGERNWLRSLVRRATSGGCAGPEHRAPLRQWPHGEFAVGRRGRVDRGLG